MSCDTKIDDGGFAFPKARSFQDGMSLRDWLAGQALVGMIAGNKWDECSVLENAEDAYLFADAMLKVRKVNR